MARTLKIEIKLQDNPGYKFTSIVRALKSKLRVDGEATIRFGRDEVRVRGVRLEKAITEPIGDLLSFDAPGTMITLDKHKKPIPIKVCALDRDSYNAICDLVRLSKKTDAINKFENMELIGKLQGILVNNLAMDEEDLAI
jgi:hypothetical protein